MRTTLATLLLCLFALFAGACTYGTRADAPEVANYEQAAETLIGKSPDEVRKLCGAPKDESRSDCTAGPRDATPEEMDAFLTSSRPFGWEYDGFTVTFNGHDVVAEVERVK